jgi:hypothetical protein
MLFYGEDLPDFAVSAMPGSTSHKLTVSFFTYLRGEQKSLHCHRCHRAISFPTLKASLRFIRRILAVPLYICLYCPISLSATLSKSAKAVNEDCASSRTAQKLLIYESFHFISFRCFAQGISARFLKKLPAAPLRPQISILISNYMPFL